MSATALALGAAGSIVVVSTWVGYLRTIPRGRVPVRPIGSIVAQLVGIGLAIAGIVVSLRTGGTLLTVAAGGFALTMGPTFLWLLTQRKTPVGDLKVGVGDELLAFEARTDGGIRFHSETLQGQRTLLKFFRGHW